MNPAPDGFNGKDFSDSSKAASCTAGRVTFPNASATKIDAASRPYEIGGRGALGDSADFMGSGTLQANYWITPDVYNQVFNGLAPAQKAAQSQLRTRDAAAPQRLLFYEGSINATGTVRLSPWYGMMSSEPAQDTTGDTQIQAVDASGKVLSSQAINPQFFVLSRPPRTITWAPFEGALRFPDGTVKFQIVKTGAVLTEVAVSANDPAVTAVSPVTDGQTLDGPQTITWTATDADNDTLTFNVEYNPNPADSNSEWLVLATGLTAAQWQEDFSTLPGAKAAADPRDGHRRRARRHHPEQPVRGVVQGALDLPGRPDRDDVQEGRGGGAQRRSRGSPGRHSRGGEAGVDVGRVGQAGNRRRPGDHRAAGGRS